MEGRQLLVYYISTRVGQDTSLAGYRISGGLCMPDIRSKTRDCAKFSIKIQLGSVRLSICPSKHPYVCPSERLSISQCMNCY